MSSVAYATEEVLRHLAPALALGAFAFAGWIGAAIAALLIIVAFSYRQTIAAYPNGGGSYIVATDNLGRLPGLIAGAALLVDYVLTVAVSISSGVFALTSLLPTLTPYAVELAVAVIVIITIANLRGVRESGAIFSFPTYAFIFSMLTMIVVGAFKVFVVGGFHVTPSPGQLAGPGEQIITSTHNPITLFLILSAFASGCSAMTGVEAISNGVPAFRKPEAPNARTTLVWMAGLLLVMFAGITWLATYGAAPRVEESILSQIARSVFGRNLAWYVVQVATAGILTVAANTSYADFPRLTSLIARDRYLPRQFVSLGDRLVFSNGIIILALFSIALVVYFNASTTNLIPLYAVGVFLSFTLSQAGMVVRWYRLKTPGWQRSAAVNGLGALTTFVVLCVIILAKFAEGAWVVTILIPLLVLLFLFIHRHYVEMARQLSLEGLEPPPPLRNTVIVPVSTLHRGTVNALKYAEAMAPGNVTAVHISLDPEQAKKIQERWKKWGGDIPLIVLDSPYRSMVRPLLNYIEEVDSRWDNDIVTVVLPEFVAAKWWHHLLHNQTSLLIKGALLFRKNKAVVSVPYRLEK
jgi:amino acid transporter